MTISAKEIIQIVACQLSPGQLSGGAASSITSSTYLIRDLGLSSVEFVVIFEKIQQIQDERINFIDLIMVDRSTYVDDLSIGQIVDFLSNKSVAASLAPSVDPYSSKRALIRQADIDLLDASIRHQSYQFEEVKLSTRICFLLSSPRSGSTLLRRMLGCHPQIYAPMELHLMAYQDFAQRRDELCGDDHVHLLEGTIVARQEVRGMSREVSLAVDQMYALDKRPPTQFFTELDPYISEQVLIDKTPTYAFSKATLERLKSVFPDALFIHLTRRPNAVIKSMIDSDLGQLIRFMTTSGIQPNCFAEALWCLCEQNIRAALKDVGQRTIRVEYEKLVNDPENIMASLHSFLGITSSQSFNPYSQHSSSSQERAGIYAGDLKTYLRNNIDPSVANEWEGFESLHWLSEPTLALLQNE